MKNRNRPWGPVVYASNLASQATLKEFAILAEIVEQPGKSGFIACPEDGGVPRCAFRDGDQMFADWFSMASAVCTMGEWFELFRH